MAEFNLCDHYNFKVLRQKSVSVNHLRNTTSYSFILLKDYHGTRKKSHIIHPFPKIYGSKKKEKNKREVNELKTSNIVKKNISWLSATLLQKQDAACITCYYNYLNMIFTTGHQLDPVICKCLSSV